MMDLGDGILCNIEIRTTLDKVGFVDLLDLLQHTHNVRNQYGSSCTSSRM